jgi:hypothetical protein
VADVEQERVTALWREAAAALDPTEGEDYIDSSQSHIAALEAERDRLREQLDAARQALTEIAERGEYFARSGPRHPQNAGILANLARAALGVEGEQE